jgi:hypothetical protein
VEKPVAEEVGPAYIPRSVSQEAGAFWKISTCQEKMAFALKAP